MISPPVYVKRPERFGFLVQGIASLFIGLTLFFALAFAAVIAYDRANSGTIYPGVSVGGIDLSGMTPPEAANALANLLDYPTRGQIAFQEGSNVWTVHPVELGLYIDSQASAVAAYNYGRSGNILSRLVSQYNSWRTGVQIPPLMVYDERAAQAYLKNLAAQIDKPVIEASLQVNGIDVVVTPGQVGRTLDVDAALQALRSHLPTLTDGVIPLVVTESPPVIIDVSEQAEIAEKILSAPLTISIPDAQEGDPGPWTFDQAALAEMIDIERVDAPEGSRYQVGLNTENLRNFLVEQAPKLLRYPQNPRVIFNDDTDQLEVIQNAVIGRALDVDKSLEAINAGLAAGEHNLQLHIAYTNPQVLDTTTAAELGIRELVSEETSYFRGSSSSRMQNIKVASSRFHGILIPPGASVSMAEILGDVSLDTGYEEALIILGDRTIQGVGGGVCQVSTTLFRTVFFGGYPVSERHSHAYRVGYYEQTSSGYNSKLAGLDATVFVPVVDFKFINDRSSWLLMETYVNESRQTLTWKFYSTSDGRTVEWDTTGPTNIVEPEPPIYEEDPDLPEGKIVQVDYASEGADVRIDRTVYRDGSVLFTDTFATHYLPWRAVFQYGPGTELPEEAVVGGN